MPTSRGLALPGTLAAMPQFVAQRHAQARVVGRCTATTDAIAGADDAGIEWLDGVTFREHIRNLSLGLQAVGVTPGSRVALLAESRPEWLVCDFAILGAGAATTPLYPTLSAEQVAFILRDSESGVVVCSTAEQLAKVTSVVNTIPTIKTIVVLDAVDVHSPATTGKGIEVVTYAALLQRGGQVGRDEADRDARYEAVVRTVQATDLAMLIYTSGTTGEPKGVMLTHANLMSNLRDICEVLALRSDDRALSFLPLCHTFERMVACVYLSYGTSIAFAESTDTIGRDLLRVRPTVMTGVPRVFEKLQARILERGSASGWIKRRVFAWAMDVARQRGARVPGPPAATPGERLQGWLADRLVFRQIRTGLGGQFRFVVSGSAPLSEAVGRWFHGWGLPILEGYGLTETAPVLTVMPGARVRFGTVGVALPSVDLRIAEDGEVLARGPNVMVGYYRRPRETAEVMTDDWFHTGDLGAIDSDGYLRITGRKKELLVTSGGKKIAPQPIEERLRASPLVSEAVVAGEGRHFAAVLIVPDLGALSTALSVPVPGDAERRAAWLAGGEVQTRYASLLDDVNAGLARFEQLKTFRLLPQGFSEAGGELTPTLKVRRKVVFEKYAAMIAEIYDSSVGRGGSM